MKTHASDVLQLGWDSRQHRLTGLTTDRSAAIAASFLTDPNVTWKMLQAAGVPMYDPDETVPAANYRVLVDSQRWIAAKMRRAKVEIFGADEGGSHFMFMENPDKFNRVAMNFLSKI